MRSMNGKARRLLRSNITAPSRSCTLAGWTTTFSRRPSVSTRMWRLRPVTFLPASKPCGSSVEPPFEQPWRSGGRRSRRSDWRRGRPARARPGLKLGDRVSLSIGGRPTNWRLVGVAREIGGGGAYAPKASYDALAGTIGGGRLSGWHWPAAAMRAGRSPSSRRRSAMQVCPSNGRRR